MKSSAPYVQDQLLSVVGYCKICGEPIIDFLGVKKEICYRHMQNQEELELNKLLDEYVERTKLSDYSGSLTRKIL